MLGRTIQLDECGPMKPSGPMQRKTHSQLEHAPQEGLDAWQKQVGEALDQLPPTPA